MYQTKIDDGHNIDERSIESLKPYARNARTHSKKQIKQIAASIERFGFTNPVLIGDDESIIAGYGRVEAAKLLPNLQRSRPIEADKDRVGWLLRPRHALP